jgi:hypothetical protein
LEQARVNRTINVVCRRLPKKAYQVADTIGSDCRAAS